MDVTTEIYNALEELGYFPQWNKNHSGVEFNYMLEGRVCIIINGKEIIMEPGDSLIFDSQYWHGMKALDGKEAKFLAIVSD